MHSYGRQQQAYAAYNEPTYTYHTSTYPTARDRYTYSPSSSSSSRTQERYTYAKPPSYAYGKTNSTPPRNSTYDSSERRHNRVPSDEYYRERASPDETERYYGYQSPRGSPPPPYESDDYEDRFYDEHDRAAFYNDIGNSTKSKTYTYNRPVEEKLSRSRSKKEKESTKTSGAARKRKSDSRTTAEPSKYTIKTTKSSSTSSQPSHKSKTSFFSFGRKSSTSKPATPQRSNTSSKSSSRSHAHTSETSQPPHPRAATAADAYAHSIPAGYSLKNWDPTRRPILLLGSVFDCNSLGKWIYDWTVHRCGPMSAFADMAGDLWLLLIGLGGRCSRGERWVAKASAQVSRRRSARQRQDDEEDIDMVEEFLDAGERLWFRLEGILEACEDWMYRAARRSGARVDSRTGRVVAMGMESGCECVDSLFGRDRELEATEELMASIRLWTVRFDRNVEEVMMGW